MRSVAIIGGGAGGAAAVAELTRAGHEVTLWNRSVETLTPFQETGTVEYEGVFGEGAATPRLITTDLRAAIAGVDAILVCLPTFSHAPIARSLAEIGAMLVPVILNPGHTGGALEFRQEFREVGPGVPPIAEFSTLTYVARKYRPERVTISGAAKRIRLAALPGGRSAAEIGRELFPSAQIMPDVIACDLANVNMVLHPPGAVLGAAWVEARGGDYTFYVDGMTPGVARVMQALDDERRAVARALGHELPSLVAEMQALGTVEASVRDASDLIGAIAGGEANRRIKAPDSLQHRYYVEDFGHGLLPFLEFAAIAKIATPVAAALLHLGTTLTGTDFRARGRTAERMGIAGLDRKGLLDRKSVV